MTDRFEYLTGPGPCVSDTANSRSTEYDDVREAIKTGPAGNRTLAPRTTAKRLREVLMTILRPQPDGTTEPCARLFETAPPITEPDGGKHWYVDSTDYPGYCAACGTPRANQRHCARPVTR